MPNARLHFHEELRRLEQQTLEALDMVRDALEQTLSALQLPDAELAGRVIADDDRIDGRYLEVHQSILSLLALQAPVATDLRTAAALLDVIRHAERMGDYCVNIAKLVPASSPREDRAEELLARVLEMGVHANALVAQARQAFAQRDAALAEDLVARDDELDRLNRRCFDLALDAGGAAHRRERAMHMMLIARWIERIGDHAVDIGEEAAFVVTGQFREFTDASHATPTEH